MLHQTNFNVPGQYERASPGQLHRIVRDIFATYSGYPINTIAGSEIVCPGVIYEPDGQRVIFGHESLRRWPIIGLFEVEQAGGYGCQLVVEGMKDEHFCESSGLFSASSLFPMRYAETNFSRETMLRKLNDWLRL